MNIVNLVMVGLRADRAGRAAGVAAAAGGLFYAHFLTEGVDGRLHLPTTRSPEYANAADATYDLSLIRWGCRTLIETARQLHIADERLVRWRDILARLVPYHEDPAAGVLIGDSVSLADSHRHFSHLLWLYPLREKVWDQQADRDIMRRTFDHWTSMRYGQCGRIGAVPAVFLDRNVVDNTQLTPNTMYREGNNFAVESPLAGLRTEGAFLLDASRRAVSTEWVRVRSLAREPLVLRHGEVDVRDERGRPVHYGQVGPATIALRPRRGHGRSREPSWQPAGRAPA